MFPLPGLSEDGITTILVKTSVVTTVMLPDVIVAGFVSASVMVSPTRASVDAVPGTGAVTVITGTGVTDAGLGPVAVTVMVTDGDRDTVSAVPLEVAFAVTMMVSVEEGGSVMTTGVTT